MTDDSLSEIWRSAPPADKDAIVATVRGMVEADRADRARDRFNRRASFLVLAILCPVLVWCAATGVTPLVRGGYALMAVGAAVMISLEWICRTWSRQAWPGPLDARSQLQKTGFLLDRQASLLTAGVLWAAPIFVGTALIGLWAYQERSHTAGYLLGAVSGAGWLASWLNARGRAARLRERRSHLQELLNELE